MRKVTVFLTFVVTLGLAACTTSPSDRATSDTSPKTSAEASAKAHVDLGMAYFEVGAYETALDEANIALKAHSNYGPAYYLKALVYTFLGQNAQAQQNYLAALRTNPSEPDFNNSFGWFLCSNGNLNEGMNYLNKAAANPYYRYVTRAYTNIGYCYLEAGNDTSAESAFIKALETSPNNPVALFELADLAYRRGDYSGARNYLVRLHQGNNMNAASLWLGLRTERKLGNRSAEESYAAQLRGRFADSDEYKWMQEGRYE